MRQWIDLFEYRINHVDYHGTDLQFYRNPTLSTIASLTSRIDLRGVSDGRDFYVFDANQVTHIDAAEALVFAGQWNGPLDSRKKLDPEHAAPLYDRSYSTYFYNEKTAANAKFKTEWYGRAAKDAWDVVHYLLAPDLVVALNPMGYDRLMGISAFARLMRGAEKDDYLPRKGTPERAAHDAKLDAILADLRAEGLLD